MTIFICRNDIATIVHDGTTIAKDIHQLVADLKTKKEKGPDATKILYVSIILGSGNNALSDLSNSRDDAAKVAQDITTLVDDISTLAKAVKPKSGGESPKPAPAPKIPGFPFL